MFGGSAAAGLSGVRGLPEADELAAAQEALWLHYPRPEEYFADPAAHAWLATDQWAGIVGGPWRSWSLNRLAFHPDLLDLAERFLGSAVVELRRHLRDHQSEGIVFRGLRGAPMMRRDQFYASAWKPALVGADLPPDRFRFHALRHFCASNVLAEGAPLTAVAGHLGDTVETVSRVYIHWLRDDRDVPAAVLDRVLAPATGDLLRTEGDSEAR